jgi:hypothetical protein
MAAIDSGVFGYRNAAAVTPADASDVTSQARALYIGTAGNLAVQMPNGQTVTFIAVPAGTLLPITVNRVLSTNTTCGNIIELW